MGVKLDTSLRALGNNGVINHVLIYTLVMPFSTFVLCAESAACWAQGTNLV